MIGLCRIISLQPMKHISESIITDITCPKADVALASYLHHKGCMLYNAYTGNIEKDLIAYDLSSRSPDRAITLFGHVNEKSYLKLIFSAKDLLPGATMNEFDSGMRIELGALL